ncbi:cytidine deaminase 1 [Phtheirospermum japonicum]|uniref:Cytidine deaminase 1 n=1 Tax=Phtheirospermum japonicum TaxID=374723 RepID=A0A830DN50_9LAMI|nr:cytidine deaminase 1 [Phtheirospermum japonicum]
MAQSKNLPSVPHLLPHLVPSAQSLARPPISNYHVGAVGLGSDGRVFVGVNLEFPASPSTTPSTPSSSSSPTSPSTAAPASSQSPSPPPPAATAASSFRSSATPPPSRSTSPTRIIASIKIPIA